VKLILHHFELPLRHVFTIARGSVTVQTTLIVELRDGEHSGYGEATTDDYYGATLERMSASLESVRSQIESHPLDDPADLWHDVAPSLVNNPFALCALDEAAHDLWGKKRSAPVYRLWGYSLEDIPPSDFTIGIDRVEKMVAKLEEMPGWPIYKIKLGTPNDLEIVRELRQHTDAVFRVDANCGWSSEEAIRNASELKSLGVEFIEQPLPADDWEGIRQVYEKSALPIIADESCVAEGDVDRCHGHFHGVNIKLVKCGGLTPARRMIARARQLGLKVMVGCMTESTVGMSAIAQLLPQLDYVDMDGPVLLERDIATGVELRQGVCHFPQVNGCGVILVAQTAAASE